MAKLVWSGANNASHEIGVSHGVLFPEGSSGVAWNGLLSITESPAERSSSKYFNGQLYAHRNTGEEFSGTIEAVSYPEELDDIQWLHNGGPKRMFGLSYRTGLGERHSKIHLVYNVMVTPTERANVTSNDVGEASPFSWSFTTKPVGIPGAKPSAHVYVDTSIANPASVSMLEDILYGSPLTSPRLPSPGEVIDLFESHATLRVINNGDGTWTVNGPDDAIELNESGEFRIDWPSAKSIDAESYVIRSL